MKKTCLSAIVMALSISLLSGCGDVSTEDYSDYKNQMNNFFESVVKLDEEMNALDTDNGDNIEDLFILLDQVEEQFKYFADIEVPDEFKVTESLADEAYDYMKEANNYYRQSFSENSFNENTLEAANECYARANKRMQYVIDIIHGQLPDDENVTFE